MFAGYFGYLGSLKIDSLDRPEENSQASAVNLIDREKNAANIVTLCRRSLEPLDSILMVGFGNKNVSIHTFVYEYIHIHKKLGMLQFTLCFSFGKEKFKMV